MKNLSEQAIVEALEGAIAETLNTLGAAAGLAPLAWTLEAKYAFEFHGVHPDGEEHPDGQKLCQLWAELLGLHPGDALERSWGYHSWTGTPGDWELQVSWIPNVEIYNAHHEDDQR